MVEIFLDANFCILPFKAKIDIISSLKDIFPEPEIVIPDFIFMELSKISSNERFSKAAILLLEKEKINVIKTGLNPADNDKALLSLAVERRAVIATNDKKLRKKCKKEGVKTVFLRNNKTLFVD